MRKFWSLMKFEYHRFKQLHLLSLLLIVLLLSIGSNYFADHVFNNISSEQLRGLLVVAALFAIIFLGVYQFVSSIQKDVRQKEIWLHNPQSIYILIGAKFTYQIICIFVLNTFAFLGFFFMGDELIVTANSQYFFLLCLIHFLSIMAFTMMGVGALVIYALFIQLKRYFAHFSFIALGILLFLLGRYVDPLLPAIPLAYGEIQMNWINNYLPTFKSILAPEFNFRPMFIAQELFTLILLIGLFIGACKWIERVIMR